MKLQLQCKYKLDHTTSINILISGSANCEPTFRSPVFSSSYETFPSLSVSINVNISLITSTSSKDKWSAITCSITKLNYLQILTNSMMAQWFFNLKLTISHNPPKNAYPQGLLFESIHHRKLLEPCSHNVSQWHIWSFLRILQPWMFCAQKKENEGRN